MSLNRLYAGDTLEFGVNVLDYQAADGWILRMRLVPRFTTPVQDPITLTATAGPIEVNGETFDFAIQVSAAATASWAPGAYGWASWVESGSERVTLEGTQYQGEATVLTNPATAVQGLDTRSVAAKALTEAKAALANFAATNGRVKSYSIAGRSMEFESAADLVKLVRFWEREVEREKQSEKLEKGLSTARVVRVRF